MKSFKNVIPLFILNNINGAIEIKSDKITVIDLMTLKEYKTNQKEDITISIQLDDKKDLANIINSDLFKTAEGENLNSEGLKNYKIKMYYQGTNYDSILEKSKNVNIYISPARLITNGNISINVDNSNYKNTDDIRLTNWEKNNIYFKKKDELLEEDIIYLLNHSKIGNPENVKENIKNKITDYKKYFISSLKIDGIELKLINNTITKDQLYEIRNAILTNKKIELSLDLLKKVNLKYDTTNLRDNIKTSIEMALNKYISGHVITAPTYIEIITYINTLTRNKLTDLVEKDTNTSYTNNNSKVDLNKTYTIILDEKCYQKPGEDPSKNKFCFGFHFKIANNLKDSTEFANNNFNDDSKDSYENNDYNTIYNIVINDLKRYNTSITDNDFEILLNDSKIKPTDTFKSGLIFTVVIKNKVEGILKDKVKKDNNNNNNNNNNNQNIQNDETSEKNYKKGGYCDCKSK